MEFLKFIRSLEELLYEVMTWLVFYPRTLWRALRHPLALAARADAEMNGAEEDQFIDLVSPPLFLMITILLAHVLEIALHQKVTASQSELARDVLSSDTNLLIFRAIAWSMFPLMMAVGMLRRQQLPIDRKTLRRPFFLQCFFAAPFIFGVASATLLGRIAYPIEAGVVAGLSIAWYLAVEAAWFRKRLGIGRAPAIAIALSMLALAAALDLVIAVVVFGLDD